MATPSNDGGTPARAVRITSVVPNQELTLRFLGGIYGFLTHWIRGRSKPCFGAVACPPAEHRTPLTWKGYAPIDLWDQSQEAWFASILEITEALEECLRGTQLRGTEWIVTRPQAGKKPQPVVGFYVCQIQEVWIREAFDVCAVLRRFYRTGELPANIPNPIPKRMALQPVSTCPPKLPQGSTAAQDRLITAAQWDVIRAKGGLAKLRPDEVKAILSSDLGRRKEGEQ